jgi:hypothetical protein
VGLGSALPAAALQEGAATARASHTTPTAAQEQAIDAAVALRTEELQAIPKAVTAGRRGYLASEPDNANGEADFVATACDPAGRAAHVLQTGSIISGNSSNKKYKPIEAAKQALTYGADSKHPTLNSKMHAARPSVNAISRTLNKEI